MGGDTTVPFDPRRFAGDGERTTVGGERERRGEGGERGERGEGLNRGLLYPRRRGSVITKLERKENRFFKSGFFCKKISPSFSLTELTTETAQPPRLPPCSSSVSSSTSSPILQNIVARLLLPLLFERSFTIVHLCCPKKKNNWRLLGYCCLL